MTYESNQLAKYQGYVRLQERETMSLTHYGVQGQKWGLRRWQNKDGSLTEAGKKHYGAEEGGNKKFQKKYAKDMKKMRQLAYNTNVPEQLLRKAESDEQNKKYAKVAAAGLAGYAAGGIAASALKIAEAGGLKVAIPTVAAVLSGGVHTYGLLKSAHYSQEKKAAARNLTPEGHALAVKKAKQHMDRMEKTYQNTPLISLFREQIEAYKKEHPATELSDNEIMNNLTIAM